MCIKSCAAAPRGHYNLGQLTPGKTEDLWIDIGVPTKQGQKENNTSTTKDKVVGAMVGAKGSHPEDVEETKAHIQVSAGALSASWLEASLGRADKSWSDCRHVLCWT